MSTWLLDYGKGARAWRLILQAVRTAASTFGRFLLCGAILVSCTKREDEGPKAKFYQSPMHP